ncbi:monovalent cation:proton antiporter-2 (CPA2) family protein [Ramlibacter sp. H39-3-26]|uniref:monovalent cation:proton antiporter-2 (CPA2) family protein n=1 Tax=Curvibacter soli TaxID=3031331 RepID=UPI0023DA1AB0|nr:monovalent cation:proton antiporter-2 (CPA2) family protein [Ramlibacter sp. H39-3-26]MDF1485270.1 monovalent cation:proton antiporter-2 (CPA2) family protein [Ramlibacter sp. H39-3-26]
MIEHGLLQALIYLGAAALFVPIFKRIGLGSVLGYLVAGVAIGPSGLRLISETDLVQSISELGVVLLMFLVGLELNPTRLWSMRKTIFGLGSLQVFITITATAVTLHSFKIDWPAAVALGMAASMSSTAIALQLLAERKLTVAPPGQASFSVALFQDMTVIPLLLGLAMLSPDLAESGHRLLAWRPIATGAALLTGMVIAGRLLLRPLMRWVATIGMREIFIAFVLLLVIGSALLTESIGLSMAMGSFMAGVLLADSEYRLELEVDIDPFKGLFLGLFFMAVGLSLDLAQLMRQPLLVGGMALIIVLIKIGVMRALGRIFGLKRENGWMFALSLSQVGEFAFVLLTQSQDYHLISAAQASLAKTVVALSMLTTPLLFLAFDRWIAPAYRRTAERQPDRIDERNKVIVAGMGRFGQIMVRILRATRIPITVIDNDPHQIEAASRFGWRTYYGDASRPDVLEAAGLEDATLIVLAMNDAQKVISTANYIRLRYPKVKMIARARGRADAMELERVGIPAVREVFGSALEATERALVLLGTEAVEAAHIVQRFREHDDRLLREMMKASHDDAQMRAIFDRGRQAFLQLLQAEQDKQATRKKEKDAALRTDKDA